ncbi:MAG: hypothetical protein IPJ65_23145 [Archangiaceae bacterium]|nr:hypothetical protein [Archangiaceae bacterium]
MGCPFYAGCLQYSVDAGWESFSCSQCALSRDAAAGPQELGAYAQQRKGSQFG